MASVARLSLRPAAATDVVITLVAPAQEGAAAAAAATPLIEIPAAVRGLLDDRGFQENMKGKAWMPLLNFGPEGLPFPQHEYDKLVAACQKVRELEAIINARGCIEPGCRSSLIIAATIVCGLVAAVVYALPPSQNPAAAGTILIVIGKVISALATAGFGAYSRHEERRVDVAEERLYPATAIRNELVTVLARRTAVIANDLLLDWIFCTPCEGRAELLRKAKSAGIYTKEDLTQRNAQKMFVLQQIQEHWQRSLQHLQGKMGAILDAGHVETLLKPLIDTVAIIRFENSGNRGIESLRQNSKLLSENSQFNSWANYRWFHERRLLEMLNGTGPGAVLRTRKSTDEDDRKSRSSRTPSDSDRRGGGAIAAGASPAPSPTSGPGPATPPVIMDIAAFSSRFGSGSGTGRRGSGSLPGAIPGAAAGAGASVHDAPTPSPASEPRSLSRPNALVVPAASPRQQLPMRVPFWERFLQMEVPLQRGAVEGREDL